MCPISQLYLSISSEPDDCKPARCLIRNRTEKGSLPHGRIVSKGCYADAVGIGRQRIDDPPDQDRDHPPLPQGLRACRQGREDSHSGYRNRSTGYSRKHAIALLRGQACSQAQAGALTSTSLSDASGPNRSSCLAKGSSPPCPHFLQALSSTRKSSSPEKNKPYCSR